MNMIHLTEGSTPLTRIVIAENADRVVRFAASELRRYVTQMTGATLPVELASSSSPLREVNSIILGIRDGASEDVDGFRLATKDARLLIQGRNNRSTLYGVYSLLERLGCRFVEPGLE